MKDTVHLLVPLGRCGRTGKDGEFPISHFNREGGQVGGAFSCFAGFVCIIQMKWKGLILPRLCGDVLASKVKRYVLL